MLSDKKIKILLILASDRQYYYKGAFTKSLSYAPLTLTTLASLIPENISHSVDIMDEGVERCDYKNKHYDIVGISAVASSSQRAYALADYWRSKKAYVVMGGFHPTLMQDEAVKHSDTVITGYADSGWPLFLNDYINGRPQRVYREKDSDKIHFPVPRRDLIRKNIYLNIPTVLANPGCLNSCYFCTISDICRKKSFKRNLDTVISEIKSFKEKKFILLDPSPTSDPEYLEQFLKRIIPLKCQWAGLSTVDIVENRELFSLMIESGCRALLVGFESLNQESLDSSNKYFNNVENYKKAVGIFHDHNIPVLGCFMIGFDEDTAERLKDMPSVVDDIGIDLPRFSLLTPFPGTTLFDRFDKENRIITRDWSLYDTENVVFRPKNMGPGELQAMFRDIWLKTYSNGRILKRVLSSNFNKIIGLLMSYGFRHYSKVLISRHNKPYDPFYRLKIK